MPSPIAARVRELRRAGWVALLAVVLTVGPSACRRVPETTIDPRPEPTPQQSETYEQLVREGRGAFLKEPRDVATVEISAAKYKEAIAIRSDAGDVLSEAARSCAWLGTYGPEGSRKDSVKQGLEYANTAVLLEPDAEAGLFYHAALAGLLADLDSMYGSDAVAIIEGRMLELLASGSTFLFGGPDRVLAILYMRAPGAPLSVGDYDKALTHMQRALDIEPHWLENQLYMAELELRLGEDRDDPDLTGRGRQRLQETFLDPEARPVMAMGLAFELEQWKRDARTLLAEHE